MSGVFDVLVGKTVSEVEYVDDFEGGITLRFTDESYLGVSMNLRESCLDVAASIETYDVTDEETGKWVIVHYFPHEPAQVYGFFDTEEAATDYAERQSMSVAPGAYTVQMVLNAHLQVRREPWE